MAIRLGVAFFNQLLYFSGQGFMFDTWRVRRRLRQTGVLDAGQARLIRYWTFRVSISRSPDMHSGFLFLFLFMFLTNRLCGPSTQKPRKRDCRLPKPLTLHHRKMCLQDNYLAGSQVRQCRG